MTVYALQETFLGPRVAGVSVFTGLEESGQINVYAQLSSDLAPFETIFTDGTVQFWKVTYIMEGQLSVDDFGNFSKLEGYPDRYRLGSYRWLSGNRPQPLKLLDCLSFSEEFRHTSWVVVGVAPERTFLETDPTTITSYDGFFPLSWVEGQATTTSALVQAEQFAFSLFRGVTMNLNLQYVAEYIAIGPFEGVPQDVFLPFI